MMFVFKTSKYNCAIFCPVQYRIFPGKKVQNHQAVETAKQEIIKGIKVYYEEQEQNNSEE